MKNFSIILIFLLIVLVLVGVIFSKGSKFDKMDERPKVATTFTIIADIAQNIAGDKLKIESITKLGAEIHDYQPTPRDILKVQSSIAILINGFNLERWFEKFFLHFNDLESFTITEGIEPLSIYEGPYTGKPNPHAWMSPKNALIYIDNIVKIFSKIDSQNSLYYRANAENYKKKILKLKKKIENTISKIPQKKRWLVTSEGAFSYLAKDIGFKELYLWPINADQQGTPQQMKSLIEKIRKFSIPVIFSESTISDRTAKKVSQETGIVYGGVLYVDSLSEKGGLVPSYLDLLTVTVSTIVEGFRKAKIIK